MEYILNILELKYILLQFSVLFLHVGVIVVWLGSGKDHIWAENTWKSPQNVKYIQRFVAYECYDSSAPSPNMNIS